jgi:intracellular septation protein A
VTTFSFSAVVLLGILMIVFIRNKSVKLSYAILAALFGFFLAKTSAAAPIQTFLDQIATTINNLTK